MDSIKAKMAALVRNRVVGLHGEEVEKDLGSMRVHVVTDLVTQVSFWTPKGYRYFSVQVRGHY